MAQDPSGTAPQILDSTSNHHHGTSNGSMTSADLVDGDLGKAIDFDGGDDYINCGSVTDFDGANKLTIETISARTSDPNNEQNLIHHSNQQNNHLQLLN